MREQREGGGRDVVGKFEELLGVEVGADDNVVEIGCGVGQYVVKSLQEYSPEKIVAFDLTEVVDTLRRIILERYPQHLARILFVQGSVFSMPFRPASFDYVYSLGVLHHTGDTRAAIRAAAGLLRQMPRRAPRPAQPPGCSLRDSADWCRYPTRH